MMKKITDYNVDQLQDVIAMLDEDGDDDEQFVLSWLVEQLDKYSGQFDPDGDV
jgi:thymidylate synthase